MSFPRRSQGATTKEAVVAPVGLTQAEVQKEDRDRFGHYARVQPYRGMTESCRTCNRKIEQLGVKHPYWVHVFVCSGPSSTDRGSDDGRSDPATTVAGLRSDSSDMDDGGPVRVSAPGRAGANASPDAAAPVAPLNQEGGRQWVSPRSRKSV